MLYSRALSFHFFFFLFFFQLLRFSPHKATLLRSGSRIRLSHWERGDLEFCIIFKFKVDRRALSRYSGQALAFQREDILRHQAGASPGDRIGLGYVKLVIGHLTLAVVGLRK